MPSRVGRTRSRRLLRSGRRSPSPARQSLRPRCVSRPEPQGPRAPSELQATSGSFPIRRRSRGFSSKNSRGPRRASRKLAAIHNIPPELSSSRSSSSAKPPSASDRTSARARSRPSDGDDGRREMGKADELGLQLQLAVGIGLDRHTGEVVVGERDLECGLNHGLGTWRRRSGATALRRDGRPGL